MLVAVCRKWQLGVAMLLLLMGSLLTIHALSTVYAEINADAEPPAPTCDGCHTAPLISIPAVEVSALPIPRQNDPCEICHELDQEVLVADTDQRLALGVQTTAVRNDILVFLNHTPAIYHQDSRFTLAVAAYHQATAIVNQPLLSDAQAVNAQVMLDRAMNALADLQNDIDSGVWTSRSHHDSDSVATVSTTTSLKSTGGLDGLGAVINIKPPPLSYLAVINTGGIFILALCILFTILSYCIPDDSVIFNTIFGYNRRLVLNVARPPFLFVLPSCALLQRLLSCVFWTSTLTHHRLSGPERAFFTPLHRPAEASPTNSHMTIYSKDLVFERSSV